MSWHGNLEGRVLTVRGEIKPEELGPTLMHEHILCDLTPLGKFDDDIQQVDITLENVWEIRYHWCNHPGNNLLDQWDLAVNELKNMRVTGCHSIVELTTRGIKRNPLGLLNISKRANVNIIMGCGFYTDEFISQDVREKNVMAIAKDMISEFVDGVDETGVRPGIIGEIGCSHPWTEVERKIMLAAVITQQRTGATISIHPGRHPDSPLKLVKFIVNNGGDPSRIVVSHIDRTIFELNTLLELLDTGCVIEYDFFGIESSYYPFQDIDLPNDGMRLNYIRSLVEKGYLNQILISHDICTKTRLIRFGGHGYPHIFTNIVPMMKRKGFNTSEINTILVENPRRLLTIQ